MRSRRNASNDWPVTLATTRIRSEKGIRWGRRPLEIAA